MALNRDDLWVVVPVKSFDAAKSRLQFVLPEDQRSSLARNLQTHVLDVLDQVFSKQRILVVSRDGDALALAASRGVQSLIETGDGLNPALRQAAEHIVGLGASSLLILASDLPLLVAADVTALLENAEDGAITIAPDRGGTGTNALLLQPPGLIEYAFGVGSYQAHCAGAEAIGVPVHSVRRDGLAFDLDLPGDLSDLRLQAGAQWLGLWPQSVQA